MYVIHLPIVFKVIAVELALSQFFRSTSKINYMKTLKHTNNMPNHNDISDSKFIRKPFINAMFEKILGYI